MSSVLDIVMRMRRLAERLPELGSDGEWLADTLARWLSLPPGRDQRLEEALGLVAPRGGRSWRSVLARHEARVALERLGNLVPRGTYSSHAEAVRVRAERYRRARWLHDRDQHGGDCSDPERAALRDFLLATDGVVPSRRSIQRVLAGRVTSSRTPVARPVFNFTEAAHEEKP